MANNLSNPLLESVPAVLAQSGAAVALTGSTAETTLATIPIPAGALRQHGRLRLWLATTTTNNANAKTLKAKLNGNLIGGSLALASTASQSVEVDVVNGRVPNSNYGNISAAIGATVSNQDAALTVDTTQAMTLTITGQLGTSTDTLTLQAYSLEVFNV